MKILSLQIHNIGLIADETIKLDKPLLIFYGEIRQGKTTVLNSVRWVCGGAFPSDIIRHGEQEAFIEMGFDGGCIRREWYVAKDGTVKARDVKFVRDGRPVPNPVAELKRFLNPFLLDQDHLRNMGETERKKYFTELFAVDTKALDVEWFNNDREASNLRAKIKGYGNIDLTKVEAVDAAALQGELAAIESVYNATVSAADNENEAIRKSNSAFDRLVADADMIEQTIPQLEEKIKKLRDDLAIKKKWLADNPRKELKSRPTPPDTSTLRQRISDAGAANVRAQQYSENVARAEQRREDEESLTALEKRQREIKAEKIAKLKDISTASGIEGLEFDEEGNFTFQGTQAGMLSTSQVMRLSSELSSLYPDGMSIELLDRGESLGKSIFELVERAKSEEKTILATVVGERPATVSKEIGVFVVTTGKLA